MAQTPQNRSPFKAAFAEGKFLHSRDSPHASCESEEDEMLDPETTRQLQQSERNMVANRTIFPPENARRIGARSARALRFTDEGNFRNNEQEAALLMTLRRRQHDGHGGIMKRTPAEMRALRRVQLGQVA